LALSTSTLQAVLLNTAANFLTSALLGLIVFEELHGLRWWFGLSLLLCGAALISTSQSPTQESAYSRKNS